MVKLSDASGIFLVILYERKRKERRMEDRHIVELYLQRNERAIAETHVKYGRYCHYIAYNILWCTQKYPFMVLHDKMLILMWKFLF